MESEVVQNVAPMTETESEKGRARRANAGGTERGRDGSLVDFEIGKLHTKSGHYILGGGAGIPDMSNIGVASSLHYGVRETSEANR